MKIPLFLLAIAIMAITASAASAQKQVVADNKLVVGYWVPWGGVPVSAVDMTKYTHIN
jgi:chitinase